MLQYAPNYTDTRVVELTLGEAVPHGSAHIDFETRNALDLRQVGLYAYAEHYSMGIWGFSWTLGDGLYYQWRPGDPDPVKLLEHITRGGLVKAHNAAFERRVWRFMRERMGKTHWPELRIEQQDCTMARAAACALPQDLDTLSSVLNQTQIKDQVGAALMKKMASPARAMPDGSYIWHDDMVNVDRLMSYCDQDVRTEEETDTLLPPLEESEYRLWQLDQRINDRGVHIDINAVTRAIDVVLLAKKEADERMKKLTGGVVSKCTELAKIVTWINAQGIKCNSMRKGDHDELMVLSDLGNVPNVRKVIELRREASKTSTAKYSKMLLCACEDDTLRGLLAFHNSGNGRFGGRLVQPQNLPRVDPDTDGATVEYTVNILSQPLPIPEIFALLQVGVKEVMPALSKSLRGMICARPGNKLVGGDYSNIEGRINAWLAREIWKLNAFIEYDCGIGSDLYKVTAARLIGKLIELITKAERQALGKVPELALGYQGGVGAFIIMGNTYDVKMYDLVKPVQAITPPEVWDAMAAKYASAKDKHSLPEDQWTAAKIIVQSWRTANANITQSWWDLQDAAILAVDQPGTPVQVYGGRAAYVSEGGWLYCRLPSGRVIRYCNPHIAQQEEELIKLNGAYLETIPKEWLGADGWLDASKLWPHEIEALKKQGAEVWTKRRNTVKFLHVDSETRQWRDGYLYGGLQCAHIVSGTARDVLKGAMFRLEDAGYPLVLTVHDETLSEVPVAFGSASAYKDILEVREPWTEGLPITAAAWEDQRYVK